MTDLNYTAIMLLVDRSGSMKFLRQAAEGAINEFVNGQREQPGRRTIRIAQFDDEYTLVHESRPAAECPPFELIPRGTTALLDAMGRSISEFGAELAAMPPEQRPGTVIYAVMTDGLENTSKIYTWRSVHEMVRRQEQAYRWQILYLGANQDAIATAAQLGVQRDRAMTYAPTDHGTHAIYDSLDTYVATASAGQPAAFTDEDRENAIR